MWSIAAAIVIAASLASLARAFAHDGLPSGHDATAHITYTYLFDRTLSAGQLPVRWTEWVRPGEGQPLFNFYPPGLYYLVELVHATGLRLSTALKATVLLLWWGGAAGMFAWLLPLGRLPAGLAAVLFALSPYLIVDVFVRAAYPEAAAIACAPFVLWAIDRAVTAARGRDAALLAAGICLMLLCHLLSSLIFAPVLAGYALCRLAAAPTRRSAVLIAGGGALGVGLAAFFLVPSMLELHLIAIGRMTSGDADYQRHFVAASQWLARGWGYGASMPGLGDDMPLRIDTTQGLALGLAPAALVALWWQRRRGDALAAGFWLAAVLATMFVMTEEAAPLWRALPPLRYLQFPWRYFMVISVGAAALAALALSAVRRRWLQAAIVVAAIGGQYAAHHAHLQPLTYYPRQTLNIDNRRWDAMAAAGIGAGAFIERGFTPATAREIAPADAGRWTIVEGTGSVELSQGSDHYLAFVVDAHTDLRLRLNTHDFPGWQVRVDDVPVAHAHDERYGLIEVAVATGRHHVEATFTDTPVRWIANAISAVSLVLWLGALVWRRRAPRRTSASDGL